MSRPNYTKLAIELYRTRPTLTDTDMTVMMHTVMLRMPGQKTLDYWKTLARKQGIAVPDRRRRVK